MRVLDLTRVIAGPVAARVLAGYGADVTMVRGAHLPTVAALDLDLGIGTPITFGPSEHQASHKVWGTVLDNQGRYQILDLD